MVQPTVIYKANLRVTLDDHKKVIKIEIENLFK